MGKVDNTAAPPPKPAVAVVGFRGAGRREDARREKETGFSEVKERSEVDGFAVAVAVGPWVAAGRVGQRRKEEEVERRRRRMEGVRYLKKRGWARLDH